MLSHNEESKDSAGNGQEAGTKYECMDDQDDQIEELIVLPHPDERYESIVYQNEEIDEAMAIPHPDAEKALRLIAEELLIADEWNMRNEQIRLLGLMSHFLLCLGNDTEVEEVEQRRLLLTTQRSHAEEAVANGTSWWRRPEDNALSWRFDLAFIFFGALTLLSPWFFHLAMA